MARTGILLLLFLAACATFGPRGRESTSVGAPIALTLPDLDGHPVDLIATDGKVVVIHFWATWCAACCEEMPAVDALARELGPRGLRVYGVSIDGARADIVDFLAKTPVSFPILWDEGAAAMSRLDVKSMPVSLVVDRRGVIRQVIQGWTAGQGERERREVETLLAEP